MDGDANPVERTKRQLRCYYRCVAGDEDLLCPECGECDDHCECGDLELDDDDELGIPRY